MNNCWGSTLSGFLSKGGVSGRCLLGRRPLPGGDFSSIGSTYPPFFRRPFAPRSLLTFGGGPCFFGAGVDGAGVEGVCAASSLHEELFCLPVGVSTILYLFLFFSKLSASAASRPNGGSLGGFFVNPFSSTDFCNL